MNTELLKFKERLDRIHSELMMEDKGMMKESILFPSQMELYQHRQNARRDYYLKIIKELKKINKLNENVS